MRDLGTAAGTRARPRLLGRLVRAGGPALPVYAVCSVAVTVAELLLPAVLGRTVDAAFGGAGIAGQVAAALGLVAVLVLGSMIADLAFGGVAARATQILRHALVHRVLAVSPRTPLPDAGDLVSRLVAQAADAGRAGIAAVGLVSAVVLPVGSLVALLLIDPRLAGAYLAGAVVLAFLLAVFARRSAASASAYQEAQSEIAGRFAEALAGARTIAAAGSIPQETRRVLGSLPRLGEQGTRTWHLLARAAGQSAALAPLLQVAVIAAGGLGLAAGRLSVGELLAASQYAVLGSGLGGAVAALTQWARARAGAGRAAAVLAEPSVRYGGRGLPPGPGRLELRGVRVGPPDAPMLRNCTLVLPGGTGTAVVGSTGAGKSVLAAVAARMADPDAGTVLLDGVPLGDLRQPDLRRAVGVAFDRPVLVGQTVGDAIGLDRDRVGPDVVRACAEAVTADGFVRRMPAGYGTALADAPLSGGELQRLGLARAWPAERLLVLDDATAALDTVTDMRVASVLDAEHGRRTRLVVTHRAATAARADQVVWLDAGRVRAVGRHETLWRDRDYRRLFGGAT
jgi:ATP-binding cassette subfamily B protein